MGPQAAALIIRKGPRILSFIRNKDGFIGFPCGFVEPGETVEQAAIRECLEETGLEIELKPDPFIGFDPVGKSVVATFLATPTNVQEPTHTEEGRSAWVGVRAFGWGLR